MDRPAEQYGAIQAAEAIRQGSVTAEELAKACLARIHELEESIGAWAHIDDELVLEQARGADDARASGLPTGLLHGVPIGIKDIIDTADLPTEFGTVLHAGRTPSTDATVVSLLREAGAIILGKTVTTELAVYAPGKTRNPHNPEHTPGGSSSGSAAAVAAGMAPLAVGTQTNGSTIRPASYCGIFGFKPSINRISRYRVLKQSMHLDTVGLFARSLEDLALLADVLMVHDARDPDMPLMARPCISEVMAQSPPLEPRFAFVRTPAWDMAEPATKDAFRELIEYVNELAPEHADIVDLPSSFDDALAVHQRIMEADLAMNFAKEYRDGKHRLSAVLCEMIERGQKVLAVDYNTCLARRDEFYAVLEEYFEDYDAILTPATLGAAPHGLDTTGSPAFCTIWTLCGTPALALPVLQGPTGLPMGAQLVSSRNDDARLFRTANWLVQSLRDDPDD